MSTIRERILQTVYLTLGTITGGQPPEDPYPLTIGELYRGPIPQSTSKRLAVGIVPMTERKDTGLQFISCTLEVSFDFRYRAQPGETPATAVEDVAGMIMRRLQVDPTLNGLAIDVLDGGNVVDLDHPEDLTAEGSVFVVITYRHDLHDPRSYLGNFPPEPEAT